MSVSRIPFGIGMAILTHHDGVKPGDMPPVEKSDYLGWRAWAEVQHKAGLRQQQCGKCGRWFYPQELSDKTIETTMYRDKLMQKPITVVLPLCREHAA